MNKRANPTRRSKPDRMTAPDIVATRNGVTIDHIVGPLDRLKRRFDQKWGFDRLVELVSLDTARKYGRAVETFEQAMMAETPDPEHVQQRVGNMMRGLEAMDREATDAGAEPLVEMCWAITVNDKPAVIAMDAASAREAERQRPGLTAYTLDEIERVLSAANMALVTEAKRVFEGAEIARIRERPAEQKDYDDAIPF